jgi:hypothetical protein
VSVPRNLNIANTLLKSHKGKHIFTQTTFNGISKSFKGTSLCLAHMTQTAANFVLHGSLSLLENKHYNDFRMLSRGSGNKREHKGLFQEDVAKRMKISQESYCQMKKPRARLRQTTRQRIAAALEIEEAQLRI